MNFVALIRKDDDSDYGVEFPDFPGCVTAGSTLDEAMALAPEALNFHVEGMLEDGEAPPEPSPLDAIDASGATVAIVPLADPRDDAALRINISMPKGLLARVDRRADSMGLSRSGYLAQAARVALRS